MTIDPKDFKTLLVRLTLVTLAVRLVPALTLDLSPGEAAAALGLGRGGPTSEPVQVLHHGWAAATGGIAAALRAGSLLAEAALPAMAVLYARAAGQGSIAGLTTGFLLALGPLGMATGARSDGASGTALLVLVALMLLREGLRSGKAAWLVASAAVVAALGWIAAPALVVVPAGLFLALRAVAMDEVKRLAVISWLVAGLAGLGARVVSPGFLLPEPHAAALWLQTDATAQAASGWIQQGPVPALWQTVVAVLPIGPVGALAKQIDIAPAPVWAMIAGSLVVLLSGLGVVRGLVQADPPLLKGSGLGEGGAAGRDGWRTLGAGVATTPRTLGDRDWLPGLLLVVGAAVFAAVQVSRLALDGLPEVLQTGRIGAALALGPGLAALGAPQSTLDTQDDPRVQRRFYWTLGAVALGIFVLGAWQLLLQTSDPTRLLAKSAARQVHELVGGHGAVLTLGRRGLPVAAMLDAGAVTGRVQAATLDGPEPLARLVALLARRPHVVVLAGDADALGLAEPDQPLARPDLVQVRQLLQPTLEASGLQLDEDAAFVRSGLGVLTFVRDAPGDPRSIRPQLGPDQPPVP